LGSQKAEGYAKALPELLQYCAKLAAHIAHFVTPDLAAMGARFRCRIAANE
jgi:hypothetical protein